MSAVSSCPHCGNDEYFVKMSMRGVTEYHRRFDGKEGADNSHIHDSLDYVEGKVRYCSSCKKRVSKNPPGASGRAQRTNNNKGD